MTSGGNLLHDFSPGVQIPKNQTLVQNRDIQVHIESMPSLSVQL